LHITKKQQEEYLPQSMKNLLDSTLDSVIKKEYEHSLYQIGTLGGGNHFIEIQKGNDGFIYIMVHSGSRNIGKQVADFYNRKAKELGNIYSINIPSAWQLDYLLVKDK
jgi:tRNA-splicing ligase RtcB